MIVMRLPLDAQMLEVGADKKLLKVYQMPAGIEVPKPKKKKKSIKEKASSNKKSASAEATKD